MSYEPRIAVVGLGYVGLPLAVALARHFRVVGLDSHRARVRELNHGHDRTGEVAEAVLRSSSLTIANEDAAIAGCDVFIVTVPTPVDGSNRPDLSAVRAASETVGRHMAPGAIVVFESTVYPGVTEDVCGPVLEAASGLVAGRDFFLGYSPERINPGDREHTVDRIPKVVAAQTPDVADKLVALYEAVTSGGVFVARDIKTAEAAKVIENAQRDINIAFINEVTMIFRRLGISVHDVLEASRTKWNFLDFQPGLVGGHCIGVDPFYLAHCALENDYHPEIVLAGRRINDGMADYVAGCIGGELESLDIDRASVLVLGLTFKENVPDLRNSRVIDIVRALRGRGHVVDVHDPLASPDEARTLHDLDLIPDLHDIGGYDCVVGAVAHAGYRAFTAKDFTRLARAGGLMADIKGMWDRESLPDSLRYWTL